MKRNVNALILFITTAAILFSGCSREKSSVIQPDLSDNGNLVVQSNMGEIKLLKVDPAVAALSAAKQDLQLQKITQLDSSMFYAEVLAEADHDAKLEIKNDVNGDCKAEIKKHNLPRDMKVIFTWSEDNVYEGSLFSADHDYSIVFIEPVKIQVAYKKADWDGINIENLVIFYMNPQDSIWKPLDAKIDDDKMEFYVTGFGEFKIFDVNSLGEKTEFFRLDANTFFCQKFIRSEKGGKLEVGDKQFGKSKIHFKKRDLPKDFNIEFRWAADGSVSGLLNNMVFGPHGTNFNHPVRVDLSFAMADLSGVNESEISVYYFNEETGVWEYIGGEVDIKKKKIKVWLKHFSRYAVAYGR